MIWATNVVPLRGMPTTKMGVSSSEPDVVWLAKKPGEKVEITFPTMRKATAIEGQIVWFYNDAMLQTNTVSEGRIVENNFDRFPIARLRDHSPEINIEFFESGHWLRGMGHDRATSVQSAIGDVIFQH